MYRKGHGVVYLKLNDDAYICGVCGGQLPSTEEKKVARHEESPPHQAAAVMNAFRHRDDTPHSPNGPVGCWICAELRRATRDGKDSEGGAT